MNYLLTATKTVGDASKTVDVARFFAPDDTASQKIARAITKTLIASSKNTPYPLTKEMFRLRPLHTKFSISCKKCNWTGSPNLEESGTHTKATCPSCGAYIKFLNADELKQITGS